MFFMVLIYALVIGGATAWIWSLAFDTHGPWNSFFWFFMMIFLFAWIGGSWVAPFGPLGWGVAWAPIVFMGVFMALLLTAVTPRANRRRVKRQGIVGAPPASSLREEEAIGRGEATVDVFFWLLLFVLVCFAFGGTSWHHRLL